MSRVFIVLVLKPTWPRFGMANVLEQTWEERQESLRAAVNHIDLMQGDRMNNLFALLQLPFWTLHKLRLKSARTNIDTKIALETWSHLKNQQHIHKAQAFV